LRFREWIRKAEDIIFREQETLPKLGDPRMKKDLVSIHDWSREEIDQLLHRASTIKKEHTEGTIHTSMQGKSLATLFAKPSMRTRVSFDLAAHQLGGHTLYLDMNEIHTQRGEALSDIARVLSRYVDAIAVRTSAQETVEELAKYASVPVINALTDLLHPCQVLSDLLTITEKRGSYTDVKVAFLGDGNNVANSLINASLRLGFHLNVACPPGYMPGEVIFEKVEMEGAANVTLLHDPHEAVLGADIVYTDVWYSMGREGERTKRLGAFRPYQVNTSLLEKARRDVVVMHCLPARRGEEITDEVMDGPHSIILDQAENRLHLQKALLDTLIGNPC